MKAVLVINEMPKNCDECRLNIEGICGATDERIYSIKCPLKPLPEPKYAESKSNDLYWGICMGWNKCLEEIEGQSEHEIERL